MRKIVERFSAYGRQWDVYEEVEDGGKINMKELTLNDRINDRIERNKYYQTAVVTNDNVKKEFDKNNDMLSELAEYIKTRVDVEYERGLNDAWELAQKIACLPPKGYAYKELDNIFGVDRCGTASTMRNNTYQQALAKVEEYEKKKAEEAVKLVPGDVVAVDSMTCVGYKGIIKKVDDENITMLTRYGRINFKSSQTQQFNIRKTGERLDNYLELFEIFNGKMERTNND